MSIFIIMDYDIRFIIVVVVVVVAVVKNCISRRVE
jgi:hypothetical protein